MNPRLRQGLIGSIIMTAIVLFVWGISLNLEYVEEKNWQPLSGEAKTNQLYASRLFLKRMGIPATSLESLQSLDELPSTDTVLLIDADRYTLQDEKLQTLLDWVESGGHLITRMTTDIGFFDESRREPLVEENEAGPEDETNINSDRTSSDPLQQYLQVYTGQSIPFEEKKYLNIEIPGAKKTLKMGADFYQSIRLEGNKDLQGLQLIKLKEHNVIIRQRIGSGMVTLASNLAFIANNKLDNFDHAEIFWHLIKGNAPSITQPAAVWLIHSGDMPSLIQIIWQRFWPLIIMLGLLFFAWLFRVARRFGPMIPKLDEDRRNFVEHIEASGHYYWQHKQESTLIDSTRSALQQRLTQRIPGWNMMSNDQQASLLAARASLEEQKILQLLHSDIQHSPHEFTEMIKQLEYIRTTL